MTPPVPQHDASRADPGLGGPVLIVEDDDRALRLFGLYLEEAGYDIAAARSGEEALEKANQIRPVAVVLDILLPCMDGWEVLSALNALTAHALKGDEEELLAMGFDYYLTKPIDTRYLRRLVGQLIEGGRHGAP